MTDKLINQKLEQYYHLSELLDTLHDEILNEVVRRTEVKPEPFYDSIYEDFDKTISHRFDKPQTVEEVIKHYGLVDMTKGTELANLCRCNNCWEIYVDKNPQIGAGMYRINIDQYRPLIQLSEPLIGDKSWGCPDCKTDSYLSNEVGENPISRYKQ